MALIEQRRCDEAARQQLEAAGISPLLARLFAARGVSEAAQAQPQLSALLHYSGLKNIDAAADRLAHAIEQGERVMILADYDADGATACAVCLTALGRMGARVEFLVPNRFEHGYGLSPQLAELAHARGAQLLLTVDNGMGSSEGVRRAKALGMDVIITDHHLPGDSLPECVIVNPNQPGCTFASKALAGVGVAFYVMTALRARLRERDYFAVQGLPEPNLGKLLDWVALGTVADVVTLDANNRILVSEGLKRIRQSRVGPGVRALFEVARRDRHRASAFDLGFAIGPRLNAAGRLDDMGIGIACLTAVDDATAQALAQTLNDLNHERRAIEQSMLTEALRLPELQPAPDEVSLTVYGEDWHHGVIGIVASRLRETFLRPTFVLAPADNGLWRGSGRSVAQLHLRDVLDEISKSEPDLLVAFGGHAMAAGLTLRQADIGRFQAAFERAVRRHLRPEDLARRFDTDGTLNDDDLTLENAEALAEVVWGQGFAAPSFEGEFTVAWQQGVGREHWKLGLTQGTRTVEAMLFRHNEPVPERIRAVYRLIANEWRGKSELQLYLDYWEAARTPG